MSLVGDVLKETLTVGHGVSALVGAYCGKLYVELKALAAEGEAKAAVIVADVKKDL